MVLFLSCYKNPISSRNALELHDPLKTVSASKLFPCTTFLFSKPDSDLSVSQFEGQKCKFVWLECMHTLKVFKRN